jgi:hypothetical protein
MYQPDGDPPAVGKVLLGHVASGRHRRVTTVDDGVRTRYRTDKGRRANAPPCTCDASELVGIIVRMPR